MTSDSFSSGEHTLIIYSVSHTREPVSSLVTLIDYLKAQECRVSVVDSSSLLRFRHGQPPAWIAALLGIKINPQSIDEILAGKKVDLIKLAPSGMPREYPDPPDSTTFQIREAAVSAYLSYIRDDQIIGKRPYEKRIGPDTARAVRSYWWLRLFLEQHPEITTIVVPNGRAADQRAFIHAAEFSGRKVLFYEIGRARNKAIYVGWHRIHDRVGTQQAAMRATAGMSDQRAQKIARDWISRRRKPTSDINQFAKAWRRRGQLPNICGYAEIATFFSSSADEFSALGSEWNLQEWKDQYVAFDAILGILEKEGIQCRLRVHPNLTNKSLRHFWSEINKIRQLSKAHPKLDVVWPTESVDSYDLVEQSEYVIVARSTIGLEASAMGKCVWTTTPTRYDMVADVRKLWTSADLQKDAMRLWDANPSGAARFIAHLIDSDIPFSSELMVTNRWNSASPPWRVRLASFFLPQPFSHKIHVMKLELVSQINRRLPPWVLRPKSRTFPRSLPIRTFREEKKSEAAHR